MHHSDTHSTHNEEDTRLARRLHSSGRVPLERLSPLLDRARSQRSNDPEASLARLLVNSGLISGEELENYLLQGPDSDERTLLAERPGGPPQTAAADPWQVGARVAGYTLEAILGRGGMGVVMRARHVATGRLVALKGLLYGDLDGVQRFTREAQAQAAVDDHPNVVRVYEAGQVNGQCYLAMELLTGGDLSQRLKRGSPLPAHEAASVVAQLARGLAHVHGLGILHRDLKPQNVLFDEQGTPKLVDFGLARIQGAERLTQTGQVLGTPAYMAPEQALARNEVDARTDVYGLGAILFACLTGRPPFQGQLAKVLDRVISEPPPRPSSLAPGLDSKLEVICLRALAKRPEDRFQDAESFAEALEGWATGSTPTTSRSSRSGLAILGGLVLGLAAGFGAGRFTAPQTTTTHSAPAPTPEPLAPPTEPDDAPPSKAQPTQPTPVADEKPPAPPPQLTEADLRPWLRVMLPASGDLEGDEPTWHLGWVADVLGDPGERQVELLFAGVVIESLPFSPEVIRRDAFGPGAQAQIEYEGRTRGTPCTVRRRKGPVALVEFTDGDRDWVPVQWLGLKGEGADPGDDTDAKIVMALWEPLGQLYPAVVVDRDPKESRVRVAYLDGDAAWLPSEELHPLPETRDLVHYRDEGGTPIPAVFARYLAPWVVEVHGREDRELIQLDLSRLLVGPEDR